jgi:hypothetical protein
MRVPEGVLPDAAFLARIQYNGKTTEVGAEWSGVFDGFCDSDGLHCRSRVEIQYTFPNFSSSFIAPSPTHKCYDVRIQTKERSHNHCHTHYVAMNANISRLPRLPIV